MTLFRWVFGGARASTSSKPRVVYYGCALCVCFKWKLAQISISYCTNYSKKMLVHHLCCSQAGETAFIPWVNGRGQTRRSGPPTSKSGGLFTKRLCSQEELLVFHSYEIRIFLDEKPYFLAGGMISIYSEVKLHHKAFEVWDRRELISKKWWWYSMALSLNESSGFVAFIVLFKQGKPW